MRSRQTKYKSVDTKLGPDIPNFSKWSPLFREARCMYTGRTYVANLPSSACGARHFTQRGAPNLICPGENLYSK